MPTGREIMTRAGRLLSDEEYIRWTLPELCDWINDGVRAVVLAKPSASTQSRIVTLSVGTLQRIPDTPAPEALALINITRNLTSAAESPRAGGRAVKPALIREIDAQEPNWHNPATVPFGAVVKHFMFDENNPLEFYVYPGNDGTGRVEAVVSFCPTPLEATGDDDDIASYEGDIGLPEPYSVPVLDYVMFRAQSKDALEGNAGRAMAHYQQFAAAVGLKIQVEAATSPNARRGT